MLPLHPHLPDKQIKSPTCTCISETAPSHPKTRSHTPHQRGTGLCAAARPPAGSRQACRPAGTPPACLAQRTGYHPGGRRRNKYIRCCRERKIELICLLHRGLRHISEGWWDLSHLGRLHFQLPKIHLMLRPSAMAALSGGKMSEAPEAGWTLRQHGYRGWQCPAVSCP